MEQFLIRKELAKRYSHFYVTRTFGRHKSQCDLLQHLRRNPGCPKPRALWLVFANDSNEPRYDAPPALVLRRSIFRIDWPQMRSRGIRTLQILLHRASMIFFSLREHDHPKRRTSIDFPHGKISRPQRWRARVAFHAAQESILRREFVIDRPDLVSG